MQVRDLRTCRVCGCDDTNCDQCVKKTGKPCHWVDVDLCSACLDSVDKLPAGAPSDGPKGPKRPAKDKAADAAADKLAEEITHPGHKVTKTLRESLPCSLTDEELIGRARELASAGRDIEQEEADQSALKAQMRSTMKQLNARRDMLNSVVATSREYREVSVSITRDYEAGTITRVRLDTGEIIETRPMVDDERQIPLEAAA